MRTYEKSVKLNNVCYDIRGPIMDEANRMAAKKVVTLNSSHASIVSHADDIVALIDEAAKSLG